MMMTGPLLLWIQILAVQHFTLEHPASTSVNSACFKEMCTVGNLGISAASLSQLEIFQCNSALPNMKYKCSALCLLNILAIYLCFKIYYLIDHRCRTQTEISDLHEKGRIY